MSNQSTVSYRNVPDFPGYRVGDDGSVWSRREAIRGTRLGNTWHRLNPQKRRGYPRVGMWRNSKLHWRSVHRLILEAFVGLCPDGQEGCHRDNDRTNNRLSNLRWDTPSGNSEDSRMKLPRGSSHREAKLTEADIPVLKRLVAEGVSCRELGRRYGVSHCTISSAVRGKTWKHV